MDKSRFSEMSETVHRLHGPNIEEDFNFSP